MGPFEHGHGHTCICWVHTSIGRHMSMGIQLHECMGHPDYYINLQDCNKSRLHKSKLVDLH